MIFESTGVRKQLFIASCVYLGQITVGYSLGWTAPAIPKLEDPTSSPLNDEISDNEKSLIGSLLYIGGLAGPYLTGYLANVKGRKPCMILGGVITVIAFIVLATAESLAMIFLGRFLTGAGDGIVTVMSLVYLGEIAATNFRGKLLTGIGIFITGGSLVAFCVGPFVSYSTTAYIGAVLALSYTMMILCIPETPIFYALKDNKSAVKRVLEDLGRTDDVQRVLSNKEYEATNALRDWKELFTFKGNRRALLISIVLSVSQQGSGVLAVMFFATSIFKLAGSSVEPQIATIIIGCTQLFGGILTPIFIERCGRRILLLISTALCCLSMLILGVYFFLDYAAVGKLGWLPLACLVVFYVGYDSGLGIIPNALSAEMFELNVRSKGCAVAITASWLAGFLITTAFGSLVRIVGGHVGFWFFSAVCAATFTYTLFCVPETKGKSLMEIQDMLNK